MSPPLPANAPEEARHLGPLVEHFPTSVGAWRYIGVVPFFGLGCLMLFGMTASLLMETVAPRDPARAPTSTGAVAAALAVALLAPLFFIGVGVAASIYLYRLRRMEAWVFADGIVAANASRTVAWRWDDLALVWQKVTKQVAGGGSALEGAISGALAAATERIGGWIVLTLQSRDGTQIRLAGLQYANRLRAAIIQETLPRLLPAARAMYDSGTTVQFGRLGVSQQGLHDGQDVLPWAEVNEVKLAETMDSQAVGISKKGKWLYWSKVAIGKVPNAHVFFALVQEKRPVR